MTNQIEAAQSMVVEEIVPMQVENTSALAESLFCNVGRVIQTELGNIIIEPYLGKGPDGTNISCTYRDGCTKQAECRKLGECTVHVHPDRPW